MPQGRLGGARFDLRQRQRRKRYRAHLARAALPQLQRRLQPSGQHLRQRLAGGALAPVVNERGLPQLAGVGGVGLHRPFGGLAAGSPAALPPYPRGRVRNRARSCAPGRASAHRTAASGSIRAPSPASAAAGAAHSAAAAAPRCRPGSRSPAAAGPPARPGWQGRASRMPCVSPCHTPWGNRGQPWLGRERTATKYQAFAGQRGWHAVCYTQRRIDEVSVDLPSAGTGR